MLASALLLGLYARGGNGYLLGFVALVPWLLALDARAGLGRALLGGLALAIAFAAAGFAWFGAAIGEFSGLGSAGGMLVLLLAAPLLQPQLLAFAIVRELAGRRHGPLVRAFAAAGAWVGCEWLLPKLLGDTLGHGLYPSLPLRQLADLGGAAGLSVLLLLANEGIAAAIRNRAGGRPGCWRPLALVAALVLAWLGYGGWRAATVAAHAATPAKTPARPSGLFDVRDPASLITLLKTMDAKLFGEAPIGLKLPKKPVRHGGLHG